MTVNVDQTRVRDLVGSSPSDVDLWHWSAAAAAFVDARLSGSGQTAATLSMIAEHLTAHYIELGAGQVKAGQSLPDYSVTYATLDGLLATRNGRIARELDASGLLAEASKPKPTFAVL